MPNVFRHFDWKVVLFALVGCYLLPAFVLGSLVALTASESLQTGWAMLPQVLYGLAIYLGAPIAGGYFTARFAANRPKLHVLAVATLGVLLACLSFRGSLLSVIGYAIISVLLAALGAFLHLRGQT
jgi:hypothetical protein